MPHLCSLLTACLLLPSVVFCQVQAKMIIEKGRTVTNKKHVALRILHRGANYMMVSNNSSFIGAKWQPLSLNLKWKLSGRDGRKTIYAKFKNNKGVVSDIITADIELDTKPPFEPQIIINSGQVYTNEKSREVYLTLSCVECNKMKVSNKPEMYGQSWSRMRKTVENWQLLGLEGLKVVYAQFGDEAGNITRVVSDSIILDFTPPQNTRMIIGDGVRYVKDDHVWIEFSSEEAHEMLLYGLQDWIPFQKKYKYSIPGDDGIKYVHAKFRDKAGNVSPTASGKFTLDRQPPQNAILSINDNARYITSYKDVQLRLLVIGASEMMISTNPSFENGKWISYTSFIGSWPVEDTEGKKTIYVKFRDKAGNVSKPIQRSIYLDKTSPKNISVTIESPQITYDPIKKIKIINSDKKVVTLKIKATDANFMMLSHSASFVKRKWRLYKEEIKEWVLDEGNDGKREVFIKFRDNAGNVSELAHDEVYFDTQGPVREKVIINNNDEYCVNKDRVVDLELFVQNAYEMIVSNFPDFSGGKWEKYRKNRKWKLSKQDGNKSVFVKYRDLVGNLSKVAVDQIILDTKPPYNGSLVINKGKKVTNNVDRRVILNLKCEDAEMMQIGYSPSFRNARWQRYTTKNRLWKLNGQDGTHYVYARFKDRSGNLSKSYRSKIKLDRKPPIEGKIVISGGDEFINGKTSSIKVALDAKDAKFYRVSQIFTFPKKDSTWYPMKKSIDWKFTGTDGMKTLYVQFKDAIGNVSRTAYDKVGIDREAPIGGKILINAGAKYTTEINQYVNIKVSVKAADEMMISNDANFKNAIWQKLEYYISNWQLSDDDGKKTVYIKFRDAAKNETKPAQASIILDRQEPYDEKIVIENNKRFLNKLLPVVKLSIFAEGAEKMAISNSRNFERAKWEPYQTTKEWKLAAGEGIKKVYAKFRDEALNESFTAMDEILVDTKPPLSRYFKIENGQTKTEQRTVLLSIKADEAYYMMVSSSSTFEGANWIDYNPSAQWELGEGEGLKTVYVKFKDNAENESAPLKAQITYYPTSN